MLLQQITPDILRWIATQAQAGHKPDAVLQAMRASGWNDIVARSAIEQTQRGSLREPPPPTAVPEPALAESPAVIQTSDRTVSVLATMLMPRVVVFGSLLGDSECETLVELARPKLRRSHTVDNWHGGDQLSDARTSEGAYFAPGEHEVLRQIETRIAELVNWPVERGEGMQVLRYGVGEEYRPHHDYFDPTVPGAARALKRGGARVATLLMYLNTPAKGGATTFPDAGLRVSAVRGNALFFSYDRPHPVTLSLHGGAPIIAGEKWIATKWLRAETFVP
jgi:prolyl 4-hydroxylase